jgi:hypothetical protein
MPVCHHSCTVTDSVAQQAGGCCLAALHAAGCHDKDRKVSILCTSLESTTASTSHTRRGPWAWQCPWLCVGLLSAEQQGPNLTGPHGQLSVTAYVKTYHSSLHTQKPQHIRTVRRISLCLLQNAARPHVCHRQTDRHLLDPASTSLS